MPPDALGRGARETRVQLNDESGEKLNHTAVSITARRDFASNFRTAASVFSLLTRQTSAYFDKRRSRKRPLWDARTTTTVLRPVLYANIRRALTFREDREIECDKHINRSAPGRSAVWPVNLSAEFHDRFSSTATCRLRRGECFRERNARDTVHRHSR